MRRPFSMALPQSAPIISGRFLPFARRPSFVQPTPVICYNRCSNNYYSRLFSLPGRHLQGSIHLNVANDNDLDMPSANIFELLTQATVSSPSLISSLLKWYCTPHALFDANSLPSSSALCSSCYTHAERSRSAVSRTIWMINLRVQTASLAARPRAIYLAPIVNLGSVLCFLRCIYSVEGEAVSLHV